MIHQSTAVETSDILRFVTDPSITPDFTRDLGHNMDLWSLLRNTLSNIKKLQSTIIQKDQRIKYLEELSTTDELTGLTNRRGFLDLFEKELDRVNRNQAQGGLMIMIDLDNFKSINDTYGHATGDAALMLVGQTLNAQIRKMDVAARMGGDEFIILFANAHPEKSITRVQHLARKLNSLTLKDNGNRISIRASIGIQQYKRGDNAKAVFTKADTKMYDAKKERKKNGDTKEI